MRKASAPRARSCLTCEYSHSMRESGQYLLAYGLASELRRRKDLHRAHKVFGTNRLFFIHSADHVSHAADVNSAADRENNEPSWPRVDLEQFADGRLFGLILRTPGEPPRALRAPAGIVAHEPSQSKPLRGRRDTG